MKTVKVDLRSKLSRMAKSVDGFTTRELAKSEGVSVATAQNILRDAIASGLAEYAGTRRVISVIGREVPVPVFRVLGGKK